jgi:hypothetical protein
MVSGRGGQLRGCQSRIALTVSALPSPRHEFFSPVGAVGQLRCGVTKE